VNIALLEGLMSVPRKHDSLGEVAAARVLVDRYGFQEHQDDKGVACAYVRVVGTGSKILWSGHIDTAHAAGAPTAQEIMFDAEVTMLAASKSGLPLGADNAAGVWLLTEMIAAGVEGTYVIHRGEECGGVGSAAMAKHWKSLLSTHTHAIAFDRRGTGDVITHQFSGRCCSEKFANQMSTLLGGVYEPCDGGTFTDTANYTHLIPECTNISAGYEREHTAGETLDLEHLFALRAKVIDIFTVQKPELIVERKVTDTDDDRWFNYNNYFGAHSLERGGRKTRAFAGRDDFGFPPPAEDMDEYDVTGLSLRELKTEIRMDPEGYADLLYRIAEDLVYLRSADYDDGGEGVTTYDEASRLSREDR